MAVNSTVNARLRASITCGSPFIGCAPGGVRVGTSREDMPWWHLRQGVRRRRLRWHRSEVAGRIPSGSRRSGGRTVVSITIANEVEIPGGIVDLDTFRHWAQSDEFPERGQFAFLGDGLWVDLDMEELFTHNRVKTRICSVLDNLVESATLGYYFSDGAFLTNKEARISTEPDGVFVSEQAVSDGRVCFEENNRGKQVEIIGSPDMVLEVVSDSSVVKDKKTLRELYWLAGVLEYWLVDVRGEDVQFELLKRTAKGFSATPHQEGWVKSKVFGRSFQLLKRADKQRLPTYVLNMRP
jgi:Uma2 family endonuclease